MTQALAIGAALARMLRFALRVVRFNRGFAAMVVATIAVGVGSCVTTFSAVDRLLVRGPEGLKNADRIWRLYIVAHPPGRGEHVTSTTGYAAYTALRQNVRSFAAVAGYGTSDAIVGRGVDAVAARGGAATSTFFQLLGVTPILGRVFSDDEDRSSSGAPVVVLDHDYWMRHYAGDPRVIGRPLIVDDVALTIIGVLPRGFTGAGLDPVDFWVPVSAWQKPTDDWPTTWRAQWLTLVARLAPGASADAAGREATEAFRRAYTGPSRVLAGADVSLRPLTFTRDGDEPREASVVRWLAAVALLVLAIACANVANLMLARALDRRREIALRLSLGSSVGRLVRLLLAESYVLTLLGGVGGLLLSVLGVTAMREYFFPSIAWPGPLLAPRLLAATAVLTIGVAMLVALAPILEARRVSLAGAIRGGTRAGVVRRHLRDVLLVVHMALTIPLLGGAGLFVQSLRAIHALDLGIQPERVLVGEIIFPRLDGTQHAAERERRQQVYRNLARDLVARPDVEHVSLAVGLPFGYSFGVGLRVPGTDSIPALGGGGPYVSAVTGDYFATVGTPIIRGRGFDPKADSERVVVVNETMARMLWPNGDALDKA